MVLELVRRTNRATCSYKSVSEPSANSVSAVRSGSAFSQLTEHFPSVSALFARCARTALRWVPSTLKRCRAFRHAVSVARRPRGWQLRPQTCPRRSLPMPSARPTETRDFGQVGQSTLVTPFGLDLTEILRTGQDRARTRRLGQPLRRTLPHELGQLGPEEQLCLVAIVRSTSKLNVVDRRPAAHRVRLDVVELEEDRFGASTARPDKSTSCRVLPPYFRPDSRRDVASARRGFPARTRPRCDRRSSETRSHWRGVRRTSAPRSEHRPSDGPTQPAVRHLPCSYGALPRAGPDGSPRSNAARAGAARSTSPSHPRAPGACPGIGALSGRLRCDCRSPLREGCRTRVQ